MAFQPQPAKRSYFFGKGYLDVWKTIVGAWKRNFASIEDISLKISNIRETETNKLMLAFRMILNILAIVSVIVFGSIMTAVVSIVNIGVVAAAMLIIYIGFSIIWLADRIYLTRNRIFTPCPECKEMSLIPTYICPECGAEHTNLTPGVYGILHRTCTGKGTGHYCGAVLPTTFFNGRRNLQACCASCKTPLSGGEFVPICIPVVGGRSVGKTAFITAFSKEFIETVAPAQGWTTEFYDGEKERIYREIEQDYATGNTRMTDRPQDVNRASSVSFSFFVKGPAFYPEREVHIYDIAGEVFTDNSENEMQKQYQYCQGIVLMIDPFAIPVVRHRYESQLTPEDLAGIGKADINEIVDSFLNKLREVTGLSDRKMSTVPLAVVISKTDSVDLGEIVGDAAIRHKMATNAATFNNYFDTMDYLCRKFLVENGMESFVNNIALKFQDNRYFSCTAIGHTREQGAYAPQGVMPPMQWLFCKADPKMQQTWNNIIFSKKPPTIVE